MRDGMLHWMQWGMPTGHRMPPFWALSWHGLVHVVEISEPLAAMRGARWAVTLTRHCLCPDPRSQTQPVRIGEKDMTEKYTDWRPSQAGQDSPDLRVLD